MPPIPRFAVLPIFLRCEMAVALEFAAFFAGLFFFAAEGDEEDFFVVCAIKSHSISKNNRQHDSHNSCRKAVITEFSEFSLLG